MRQLLILLTALLALSSCASQYNIDGNSSLACMDGQKLYLRVTQYVDSRSRVVDIDSCEVIHGRFNFGGSVDSVAFVQVYLNNERLMPLVLEGGELRMELDNYGQSVTGGQLNERLTSFNKRRFPYENELYEIDRQARRMLFEGHSMDEVRQRLEPRRDALLKKLEDLEVKFVLDNSDNALGTGYFMQMASQLALPVLTPTMERIVDKAPARFLRNPQVRNYLVMTGLVNPDSVAATRLQKRLSRSNK